MSQTDGVAQGAIRFTEKQPGGYVISPPFQMKDFAAKDGGFEFLCVHPNPAEEPAKIAARVKPGLIEIDMPGNETVVFSRTNAEAEKIIQTAKSLSSSDINAMAQNESRRQQCFNNLKQLGLMFITFRNESQGGRYPRLSPKAGHMFFENVVTPTTAVFPEYVTDLHQVICPANKQVAKLAALAEKNDITAFDDHSYLYLGYAIRNEEELAAFAEAYKARVVQGLKFDADVETPKGKILLLRQDVAKAILGNRDDIAAELNLASAIPVIIERPGNHEPPGGHVLYLDGHVEYKNLGEWPMTNSSIEILKSLEALREEQSASNPEATSGLSSAADLSDSMWGCIEGGRKKVISFNRGGAVSLELVTGEVGSPDRKIEKSTGSWSVEGKSIRLSIPSNTILLERDGETLMEKGKGLTYRQLPPGTEY